MCGLRIFNLLAIYAIYRVTSYLRLLALAILTGRPNMRFVAPLVSDNSRSLEKFALRHCHHQPPLRKNFCAGSY